MSIKDSFGKSSNKVLSGQDVQKIYDELGSEKLLEEIAADKERFLPPVDFSSASNFARYGSAERYYSDAITNVYLNYPYDGSAKEKQEWRNNSSQLDLYVFDKIYPKSTGYLHLSGSEVRVNEYGFLTASNHNYIQFSGGPHNSSYDGKISTAFNYSNVYDPSKNRASNLSINPNNLGNTIEFWAKFDYEYIDGDVQNVNIFNIWDSTSIYHTLELVLTNSGLRVAAGGIAALLDISWPDGHDITKWNFYSIVILNKEIDDKNHPLYNNGTKRLHALLYINGKFIASNFIFQTLSSDLDSNNFLGRIGSSQGTSEQYPFIGSIDEFRFWKRARTAQEISRYWFTSVDGGSNSDDSNTGLGVYYKFNEGVSGDNDLDSTVIDYSGRISNGEIVNYIPEVRNTGSAINEYSSVNLLDFKETPDPIIYSQHPNVVSVREEYKQSGSEWDKNNITSIYNSLPSWMLEDEENNGSGDLQNFIQIISSYFDTLHNQIQSLPTIKNVRYYNDKEKQIPFINSILSSHNFKNLDIFSDTTLLEEILSRNENIEFEKSLEEIKNSIFQNIYNNLSYIYKSKGTEKSIRNLIRCYGVDDELIKINLYADNSKYYLTSSYNGSSYEKNFLDFNHNTRFNGFVCGYHDISGDYEGYSYLPALNNDLNNRIPITLQTEIIFPKKIEDFQEQLTDFTTVSLFGIHTAQGQDNLTWGDDEFNFSVYAQKPKEDSKDAYFKLVANFKDELLNEYPVVLTSSWFSDLYENEKWNFAVRIYQKNDEYTNIVTESSDENYILEFVGINAHFDTVSNSFTLTEQIPASYMKNALKAKKRVYLGAHYENFETSSLLDKTDVKISSTRFWYDYISDEELIQHSTDVSSYGRINPNWNFSPYDEDLSKLNISNIETLALNWDFTLVSGSDTSGQFLVEDRSSQKNTYDSSLIGIISKRYTGKAFEFPVSSTQVINKEFLYSNKAQLPETITTSELVQITETDNIRTKSNSAPSSFFYSIEKSMYQVMNDEMLKWFATIDSFNNIIGEPINRYRKEYTDLTVLRKLFFENVGNSPDFERFIEFFKWVDSSISDMIQQLIPASANVSNKIRNIVESHMFERNKYENKLPTVHKEKTDIVSSFITNIGYDFKDQKAPQSPAGAKWLKDRVERNNPLVSSGNAEVDSVRETIKDVIASKNIHKIPRGYDITSDKFHDIYRSKIRQFSDVYSFKLEAGEIFEDTLEPVSIANTAFSSDFKFATDKLENENGVIKNKVKRIGNYTRNYEFFQTSGRTNNNFGLNDIKEEITSPDQQSAFFIGIEERELPVRPVYKSVIVERFSAPGGREVNSRGFLDTAAEEYSVYNEINNRNLGVRNTLKAWDAATSSLSQISASHHKVNKNTGYRINSDENAKAVYDNNFISHQIPKSDVQYAWVTASVLNKPKFSAYYKKFDNIPSYDDNNFNLLSGSSNLDYLGLNINSSVVKTFDTASGTVYVNTSSLGSNLNAYLSNINGPYQGASWKQTFKHDAKFARESRRNNNILSQQKGNILSSDKGLVKQKVGTDIKTFKQPAVQFNIPVTHKVNIEGSKEDAVFISSYDNNKEKFSNQLLSENLDVNDRTEQQLHEKLIKLQDGDMLSRKAKITGFERMNIIVPPKNIVGLKEVRTRPNYEDNGFTGSVVNEATYWRDSVADRKRDINAYDMFEVAPSNLHNIGEPKFYMYNQAPTSSIVGNYRESISATDVYRETSSDLTSTNYNIQYDELVRGNLYKNSLMEEKRNILNSIKYEIPNFVKYDLKLTNFYSINDSIHPPRDESELPVFLSSPDDRVCCTLSCSDGLYIGGKFTISGSENIIKWNGINFEALGSGLSKSITYVPLEDGRDGVMTIVSASDGIYAGGIIDGCIQRWNGDTWTNIGTGGLYTSFPDWEMCLTIISCSAGIIAGSISGDSGLRSIVRLDSGNWADIGNGFNYNVRCILSCSEGLYVGTDVILDSSVFRFSGDYNDFGATFTQCGILESDDYDSSGGEWIGGGTWSLISSSEGLYSFGRHNGGSIALWDGDLSANWDNALPTKDTPAEPLMNRVNDYVFSAISKSEGIYVGGAFTTAVFGDDYNRFNGVALWNGETYEYLGRSNKRSGVVYSGKGSSAEKVYCLENNGDDLFVGGYFSGVKSGPLIKDKNNIYKNIVEGFENQQNSIIPHPQLVFNNFIPHSSGSLTLVETHYDTNNNLSTDQFSKSKVVILNEGYIRETEEVSGKKPFFDSYEDYLWDIKNKSQKYSLVPEFTISDFVKDYIHSPSNFKSTITSDYLKLDGAINSNNFQSNNSINISDPIDFYTSDKLSKNNEELQMNIRVSGIKKLLPKRDFYPSERILTLSKYFIDSFLNINPQITSSFNTNDQFNFVLSNGTPLNGQILTLLQPMFAPGILLNTIKSSVAVDWPVYIADSGSYDDNNSPDFYSSTSGLFNPPEIKEGTGYNLQNTYGYRPPNYLEQDPSIRLPFEALIEFDSIIPAEYKVDDKNLYYLNPTHYTSDILTGSDYDELSYPSYNMGNGSLKQFKFKDPNYQMAMHNFLAEVPNMFLQNGLNKFVSSKSTVNAVAGITYKMDVVLEKSNGYKSFMADPFFDNLKSDINNEYTNILLPSADSLYGPPMRYWETYARGSELTSKNPYNLFSKTIDTPAYAAYTPPYYYGKSVARISFECDDTRQWTINEILGKIQIEYINEEADKLFLNKASIFNAGGTVAENYNTSPAYKNMMKISSSVNLDKLTTKLVPSYNEQGVIDTVTPESEEYWVIQSKFETPSINFANVPLQNNIGLKRVGVTENGDEVSGVYSYLFKGLWTSYGQPSDQNDGIFMYIENSTGVTDKNSLAKLCGFEAGTRKLIGGLGDKKQISEGVVMIPFTSYKTPNSEIAGGNAITIDKIKGETEENINHYYFSINRNIITRVLGLPFEKQSNISYEQIKKKLFSDKVDGNNSIIKLMRSMTKYVIPPHLDWIRNRDIEPFVMYIADFELSLSTEDLSDIWQGVMPSVSQKAEEQEILINHKFAQDELFHGKKIPNDVRFKTFKVKQRANINYYELTENESDDAKFKFTFGNSQQSTRPEYSYNWPYDFCSVVEYVSVEAGVNFVSSAVQKTSQTTSSIGNTTITPVNVTAGVTSVPQSSWLSRKK